MDKTTSLTDAVADIPDGASIMFGGFCAAGLPLNLVTAIIAKGARNLTLIANSSFELLELVEARTARKLITTYARIPSQMVPMNPIEQQVLASELELEQVPQGTFVERIRAAGAGLGGIYVTVGVGTFIEEGKESKIIDGKKYLLEKPLYADYAFVKGFKGDKFGNLIYRKTSRNINPIIAMAAKTTIAEVETVVDVGQLDPEHIITPGIFVDRIVRVDKKVRALYIHG
jgi:3-oxoadipate CoA-transferase alpha subunit